MHEARKSLPSAPLCALACGILNLFGYWFIALFLPEFWGNIDEKTQIIKEHTLVLQLWHAFVWLLPGLALIYFNRAALKTFTSRGGLFEIALTLTCFATASYGFLIGVAEILSAHLLIENGSQLSNGIEQDIHFFMSMIMELRRNLEAYSDSWFLLFNIWLFVRLKKFKVIAIIGVVIVFLGFSIPLFGESALVIAYVHGKAFWWFSISYLFLKVEKQSRDNSKAQTI